MFPDILYPMSLFIYVLDLASTVIYSANGASKALKNRLNMVGVVFLAISTAVAGGTVRDVIMGKYPFSFSDPAYIITIAISCVIVYFFVYPHIKKHWNLFLKFDAVALGTYSVIGSVSVYVIVGLDFVPLVFGGLLTAVRGGILRDLFVKQIPIIFVTGFYATAAFVGAVLFYIVMYFWDNLFVAVMLGMSVAAFLRIVTIKYDWNPPGTKDVDGAK